MVSHDHGKRKLLEKDMPRHGRVRASAAGGSGAAPHGGGRVSHDQYIEDEERQEMLVFMTDNFTHFTTPH
jgi:hypothetical protein